MFSTVPAHAAGIALLCAALLTPAAGLEPRPWDEAKAKASEVMMKISHKERRDFLHGVKIFEEHKKPGKPPPVILAHEGYTRRAKDLGVPSLKMQDAASGFRNPPDAVGTSTCFPSMLALASTWDVELAKAYGTAIGSEFKGKGANVLLGPSLNVHHAADDGRNVESLSGEDPYLGASLARAYIGGVQSKGVIAAAKNFAYDEHRPVDEALSITNVFVDNRTAWELYYPPFEAAVEAGAVAVMCPGNLEHNVPACGNSDLLQRDLKQKMGFQGFVLSDWGATLPGLGMGGAKMVQQGLDLEMPVEALLGRQALLFSDHSPEGPVQRTFDAAFHRVLAAIYHLRLDEDEGCAGPHACSTALHSNQTSREHATLARAVATEAVTLLSNDGVLPLNRGRARKLAVVGVAAGKASGGDPAAELAADYYSGGGPGHCRARSVVTPLAGIRRRAAQLGVDVVSSVDGTVEGALHAAQGADIAVVVAAATSHAAKPRSSLALDGGADELIAAIARVKPTVVLMQTPGAVLTPWRQNVSAIANLFLAGQETGSAWAAVLFGDAEPQGRLPVMFPATEGDVLRPASAGGRLSYSEGRFTSYRSASLRAAYPFGHGLSFTSFDHAQPRLVGPCAQHVCASLLVTNTGSRPGREVVQAYLEFPAEAGMPRRVLRGFRKTRLLKPAASEVLSFAFTARDLSSYEGNAWTLWQGVKAHFGASSEDLRQHLLLDPGAVLEPPKPEATEQKAQPLEAPKRDVPRKRAAEARGPHRSAPAARSGLRRAKVKPHE